MSRAKPATDLRERMQRVASRPTTTRTAAPRTTAASAGPAAAAKKRTAAVTPRRAAASRVTTLLEWARWEAYEVPRRRVAWLEAVLRGR